MRLLLASTALLVLSACKPKVDEARWACEVDGDCVNTCAWGAINDDWYQEHLGGQETCVDGCNNQISGPPRCVDGGCVAVDNNGKPRDYCTRKMDDR